MKSVTEPQNVIYGLHLTGEPERIRYVGLTSRGIASRTVTHRFDAKKSPHLPVNHWKNKHGFDSVRFVIIEVLATVDELNDAEIKWIAYYRSIGQADLNLSLGGGGLFGYAPSAETRAKLSASNKGRKMSPEFGAAIRLRKLASPITPEHRAALTAGKIGKTHTRSPEVGARVSERIKGEGNPFSKLSESDVRELFAAYQGGGWTMTGLAEVYGVTSGAIQAVVRGKTWAHLGLVATVSDPFSGRSVAWADRPTPRTR